MKAKLQALLMRLPPVRWFRALEDGVFRLASEAEYRLKITPRNTKIVPNTFDRRIVRLFLIVVPVLVSTIWVDGRPMRARVLFVVLVLAALALAFIFVADAFPGQRGTTSRSTPPRPPLKAPPIARPPVKGPPAKGPPAKGTPPRPPARRP
ncbi:hypothetical protein [Gemmatimonas groenlandica]|uniref:Uncharacterized protein n=1 Tax=Gemmatimonas groenlandica TaxID=2732249 RepID=A0A6M4IJL5_9BACT|nr:hypothetical protein [Gemmatimonas groenlandica]QJR35274.1 hypothetical protein HKW67_07035 [Gemmatimonas groenlandica]